MVAGWFLTGSSQKSFWNNSERSLNLARGQILIEEEQTNKDKEKRKKTLKHPNAFMFYNTKT